MHDRHFDDVIVFTVPLNYALTTVHSRALRSLMESDLQASLVDVQRRAQAETTKKVRKCM